MTEPALPPPFDPLAPEWTAHVVRTIGEATAAHGVEVRVWSLRFGTEAHVVPAAGAGPEQVAGVFADLGVFDARASTTLDGTVRMAGPVPRLRLEHLSIVIRP